MVGIVNQILSIFVIVSQITILFLLISLVFSKSTTKNIFSFISTYGIKFAFVVALTATLGSLFYSEIAGYTPCKLCWFERIFMYPQVVILGMAVWKKDKNIIDYSMVLLIVGAFIAGYHYLMQVGFISALPCSALGYSASCSQRFVMQYGYITIPMMALTAFILIFLTLLIKRNE